MNGQGVGLAGVMISAPDGGNLRGEPVLVEEALDARAVIVADHGALHSLAMQRIQKIHQSLRRLRGLQLGRVIEVGEAKGFLG
jgi:hypothetical protein